MSTSVETLRHHTEDSVLQNKETSSQANTILEYLKSRRHLLYVLVVTTGLAATMRYAFDNTEGRVNNHPERSLSEENPKHLRLILKGENLDAELEQIYEERQTKSTSERREAIQARKGIKIPL